MQTVKVNQIIIFTKACIFTEKKLNVAIVHDKSTTKEFDQSSSALTQH